MMDPILKAKLNPTRYPRMSPVMAACVGVVMDEEYTQPVLKSLIVTSDGFLLGCREGDIGYNDFIGTLSDLERNWTNLLVAAGLSDVEKDQANAMFWQKVRRS